MTKRMLIDGAHPEETRVAIVDGNQLEDFDYESTTRQTLKGNIYLGKVTRVEPSLQACFVEYGGNRHGFLPFGEIHPDYYRIPVADREALKAAEAAALEAAEAREERRATEAAAVSPESEAISPDENGEPAPAPIADTEAGAETDNDDSHAGTNGDGESQPEAPEPMGGDDEDDHRRRVARLRRNYTIQEVIKRRQIVLVQVVKEERGTKGAALTTYISLAGRYCVLMPNTTSGGGISRKITNAADRKRLKEIVDDLDVPPGMAVILRTAGLERTKTEIKRDYEFLMKVWDEIATHTLESRAPALIHEEANLIKRTIRDSYARDVEEVLVDGEDAYRVAKGFMRALMPSHAKKVQLYKDGPTPLFTRYGVESQLDGLHSSTVRLPSGGYIVINTTEALVAIDVNSGRATRERGIEETAFKTNMEAATAVARQLRLRDLAGLIVIDFIDMEDRRNNAAVERRLKEAMKADRARLQIGRISGFGLLELSRQRLRPSLFESSTHVCPTCGGTGHVRSVDSSGLHVLRAIEEEAVTGRHAEVQVHVATPIALYLLNQKRDALNRIARDHGMDVWVEADDSLLPPAYRLTGLRAKPARDPDEDGEEAAPGVRSLPAPAPAQRAPIEDDNLDEDIEEETAEREEAQPGEARGGHDNRDGGDEEGRGRRRRGRRGGRRRGRHGGEENGETSREAGEAADGTDAEATANEEGLAAVEAETADTGAETEAGQGEGETRSDRPRRRRRRGGRGWRGENQADMTAVPEGAPPADDTAPGGVVADALSPPAEPTDTAPASSPETVEVPAVETEAVEAEPAEVAAAEAAVPESVETPMDREAALDAAAAGESVVTEQVQVEPSSATEAVPTAEAVPEVAAATEEPPAKAPRKRAPRSTTPKTATPKSTTPKTTVPKTPRTRKPRVKAGAATEAPPAEAAVTDTPVADASVAEAPVAEAPSVEAPTPEMPAAETPVAEMPVAEMPVTETPVMETPAIETAEVVPEPTQGESAPVAEAPAVEVPVEPAPQTEAAPEPEPEEPREKRRGWWQR